jgi:nucleoside-diphosphate-sugar epimerase
MRLFVTGASGYIGRALCRRLAADGHEIRALVRTTSRVEPLVDCGARLHVGDVTDRVSMREGMSGADAVIHAAADLDLTGPAGRMEEVNVGGAENVASLAWKLGVPRVLSIGSIACWGGSPEDGTPATEDTPVLPPPTRYSATKRRGDEAVRAWAGRGLRVLTVHPSLVYGPPGKKEGANALVRQLDLGRFPALIGADRRTSWIFLDDLIDGIVRVLERGTPGGVWLMAGEIASVADLAARIAGSGGAPVPRWRLPVGPAQVALRLAAPFYRLRGRRPPIPVEQLESLRRHWAFDDRRARAELDWTPRGLEAGLPPTLEHLRARSAPA